MRDILSFDDFLFESVTPPKSWKLELPGEGSNELLMVVPSHLQQKLVDLLRQLMSSNSSSEIKRTVTDMISGRSRSEWNDELYSDSVVIDMDGDKVVVWSLGKKLRIGVDVHSSPHFAKRLIDYLETGKDIR